MSDRQKSTRPVPPSLDPPGSVEPPHSSELTIEDGPPLPEVDLPALREIYACQLRDQERQTVEGLADSLLELTREATMIVRTIKSGSIPSDMRAAAVDLRHLERYLISTGAQDGNAITREESRLADLCEQLAPRVAEIAGELETAAEDAEAAT